MGVFLNLFIKDSGLRESCEVAKLTDDFTAGGNKIKKEMTKSCQGIFSNLNEEALKWHLWRSVKGKTHPCLKRTKFHIYTKEL